MAPPRYISVSGIYAPSVYGSTLEAMAARAATTSPANVTASDGGVVPRGLVHAGAAGDTGQRAFVEGGEGEGEGANEAMYDPGSGCVPTTLLDCDGAAGGGAATGAIEVCASDRVKPRRFAEDR